MQERKKKSVLKKMVDYVQAAFEKLNQASDAQLKDLLNGLSEADGEELNRHMTAITNILLKAQTAKEK